MMTTQETTKVTKTILRCPQIYYILGAFLLITSAIFFYQKIIPQEKFSKILKEQFSEFTLIPQTADAAGIAPNTAFVLKSSADLSATVVQKYLQFEPQVEYKIKKVSSGSSVFEITPTVPLDENQIYSVKIIESPIAASVYSWAYQVKAPFQIITSLPKDKSSDVPLNTGIEITFNRENLVNPEQSFEISPSIPGRFEVHRNILVFTPLQKLNPKTVYTITIKSGIESQGSDDTLDEDTEIRFETSEEYISPQPRPYFSFDKTFWEFKPDTEVAFAVRYSNLSANTVPLTTYRFGSIEEFTMAYKNAHSEENRWTRYHVYNAVTLPPDKKVFEANVSLEKQAQVRFIRMPQRLNEGFYLADVVVNNQHDQAWFQITPVAGFSAMSGSNTLLWLKDLNNGENLSSAEIAFENDSMGKTNSDGVAMFKTPTQLLRTGDDAVYYYSSPPSYFYTVSIGGRQIAIPVENEYGSFSIINPPDTWWDYFSIDKGVYLPTDKVHFWGIVKQKNGTDIKGEEITIQLTNPFWTGTPKNDITVYGDTKSEISDFYTLTGEIRFSDLKPGLYQLSVKRGDEVIVSENVNVETYVKPAYKLTLTADRNAIFAGDTIAYKIKAEFFDDTPVSNLRLQYNGYLYDQINGEVQLNQEGEGSFTIKTEYREDHYSYWPRYLGIHISPAVSEEGEINSSVSVLVFGPHIDLRTEQSFSDNAKKINLNLKTIDLGKVQIGESWWDSDTYLGDFVPNWSITADVTEIINTQTEIGKGYDIINKTTYPIYSYSTEYRPVRQDFLTTDSVGNASYEWTPDEKKSYRITFTIRDDTGRLIKRENYVYGGSFSYSGFYDSQNITLKNLDNKNQYKLGEQILLQMQNNAGNAMEPGLEKFVFIRINNGIVSYEISDSSDYRDTFKDAFVPNVNIIGVWFSGSRFFNSYPANLSFDSDERRLHIEITKDKERYRPGDKVSLSIMVTDKDGSPKQAEVNVSGIDEAVFSLNPDDKDIVNNLYQDIFASLIIRSSHYSPLLEGGSGAERGGGGGARADFRDVVIYKTVRTNQDGYAEISFDVPDNLTSWRLMAQAITKDLFAGKAVHFVPVGLPFFVETAVNRTYLTGDNLNLRARVFGTANIQDNITYIIESETLPFRKIKKTSSNIIEIPLGNLTQGKHQIKISAKSGAYSDAIIRDFDVLSSYFSQNTSEFYELSPNLSNIHGASKGYTTLLITSYERGRFYNALRSLACECGARIDQKFTRWFAETYLNRFFDEKNEIENVDATTYQMHDGGIALLPYSDNDLELSAKFAHLIKDESTTTDKESLKKYLTVSLTDRKADLSRIVTALYGLSAFKEPILVTLQNIKSDRDLTLMDKIYVALAMDSLGAKEETKTYYTTHIKPALTTQKPFVFVSELTSQDDNIIATALLAGLTQNLHEPESDGLGQYAIEHYPQETLKNFELLLYLKAVLSELNNDKVNFSWRTSANNGSKTLQNNEVFRLGLSRDELATLQFSDMNGRIGLVSNFETESSPAQLAKDPTIGVSRTYSVNGRPTTEFSDGDLVRVDITPTFKPNTLEGAYQVVDYLPSGLRAVTNLQRTPIQSETRYHLYPSHIEDQKITFVISKNFPKTFFYYARVVSRGNYKAEPVLIQSLKSFESTNISTESNVTIR